MSITFNDMHTMFKAIMTNWDYIDVCRYKNKKHNNYWCKIQLYHCLNCFSIIYECNVIIYIDTLKISYRVAYAQI